MVLVNHKQLKKLLGIYYDRKIPCFMWGTMGIGKSSIAHQVAEEIAKKEGLGFIEGEPDGKERFGFIDVRVSQLEPSDLRGLPNIYDDDNSKEKTTKWIPPNWLPRNKESKGIIFLDELNLSPATKLLVFFTDAYASFPKEEERKTLWVLTKNSNDVKNIPFGEIVKIE